jgi:HEPN domain-containing protein
MSVPETGFRAWLAKAANDVQNIDNNLAAPLIPWDTVCFHAQQAAEKTLKAFLVYRHLPLMRTHDLVALLAVCAQQVPSLAECEDDCRELTAFAVTVRYPEEVFEPVEEDGRRMIAAMARVREAVRRELPG